jgi:hypothetical protein
MNATTTVAECSDCGDIAACDDDLFEGLCLTCWAESGLI